MKGTYFLGNGEFETRDMPEHPLAPHEVLIRVAACGVCGTDVHIYHGDKGSAAVTPPVRAPSMPISSTAFAAPLASR